MQEGSKRARTQGTKARHRTTQRQNGFSATAECGRTRQKTQEDDLVNDDRKQSHQSGKFSNPPNIHPRPQWAATAAFSSSRFPLALFWRRGEACHERRILQYIDPFKFKMREASSGLLHKLPTHVHTHHATCAELVCENLQKRSVRWTRAFERVSLTRQRRLPRSYAQQRCQYLWPGLAGISA